MKVQWFAGLFLLSVSLLSADPLPPYPVISYLRQSDPVFDAHQRELNASNQNSRQGKPLNALILFAYKAKPGDDALDISAGFSLPYETIITLNRIRDKSADLGGKYIIIPSIPGLFIPQKPENDLEELMSGIHRNESGEKVIAVIGGVNTVFTFLPEKGFSSTERAFFLSIMFRFPLDVHTGISSGFGYRVHPISGQDDFHQGIDLPAPIGTNVLATTDGVVTKVGSSSLLGTYIVIEHTGGYTSLYGHLGQVFIQSEQRVFSRMIIGSVGMTGSTTGPHLHFEIRNKGDLRDPDTLLAR